MRWCSCMRAGCRSDAPARADAGGGARDARDRGGVRAAGGAGRGEVIELPDRLQAFVEPEPTTGCWLWSGGHTRGYGRVWWQGRTLQAHRVVYELLVGPIPKPQLDHLCRTPACVNPQHLRPVTPAENIYASGSRCLQAINRTKTRCPKGHPLDGRQAGGRRCTTCGRADALRRYYRRKNAAN